MSNESIRQRGSTWTALWYVRSPEGRWAQRSKGGFATRKAAQVHRREQLAAIANGSYREAREKALTVERFLVDHWLPAARSGATRSGAPRRPSTVATYETVVAKWLVPHIGAHKVAALTPAQVETGLRELREHGGKGGRPLGGRSVQVAHGVLRQALAWGVRQGYVVRNVAALVDRPGAKADTQEAWTPAEARAFLAAVHDDSMYAAWLLLVLTGLRRGELAGLRWDAVDLDANTMRITATRVSVGGAVILGTPKTDGSRRTIRMDATLVAALREHRRRQLEQRMAWGPAYSDGGWVFAREDGQPLHPESISQRFGRLCVRAGARPIPLHGLRHTTATLLLAAGTPVKVVSELLGHSDVRVTLSVYQHTAPGEHAAAVARLAETLLGGGAQ